MPADGSGSSGNSSAFSEATSEDRLVEFFNAPLGQWVNNWFYQNTNAENYYTASGRDCDPDYQGNQPLGLWISDDRGCGTLDATSPVTITFTGAFGDSATMLYVELFTCLTDVTFRVFDRDGVGAHSKALRRNCFGDEGNDLDFYDFPLTNGISAFQFVSESGQIEGNTTIGYVALEIGPCANSTAVTAPGGLTVNVHTCTNGGSGYFWVVRLYLSTGGFVDLVQTALPESFGDNFPTNYIPTNPPVAAVCSFLIDLSGGPPSVDCAAVQ